MTLPGQAAWPPLRWSGGRLAGSALRGIRYLSLELPAAGPVALVTVHLNQPVAGLRPGDLTVAGPPGARLPRYEVAIPASQAATTATITFHDFGGASTYQVLLAPGAAGVPTHPFFAAADLRFTVECETGDCAPGAAAEQAVAPAPPAVDLLTKDYAGFVRLLTDWAHVGGTRLADLSPASFEQVLLELLAWAGDMHSYYQDRVAAEAFLDTARQRYALRQHAVLLGTRLDDGQAPSTVLAFDVTTSGYLPAGLTVRVPGLPGEAPVGFSVRRRTRVYAENSSASLRLAAWPGAQDAELPAGATSLLLYGHGSRLAAGDRLALSQGTFTQIVTLSAAPARMTAQGWVATPADPMTGPPAQLTLLTWDEPLAQALSPWTATGPPLRLRANLVDAGYGTGRVATTLLASSARPGWVTIPLGRRDAVLERRPVGTGHVLRALRLPDTAVVHEPDAGGVTRPALDVTVHDEPWTQVEHLLRSTSYDTHYTAGAEEDGSVWLSFGDGVHGRDVPVAAAGTARASAEVEIRYRVGDPELGNVGAGAVTRILPPATGTPEDADLNALGTVTAVNVSPGVGGRRARPAVAARHDLPASLRHGPPARAVALSDYAAAAMAVPGVARARARRVGALFNTVLVLVDPVGGGALTDALRRRVHDQLEALRMAGREQVVAAAEYVPLEVELLVCARVGTAAGVVRDRVLAELRPGDAARPGWFHPDRLSFGDVLRLGDLIAFVQQVPGVRTVKALAFRPRGGTAGPPVLAQIALGGARVARLDADPDAPENGTLTVRVVGLDADGAAFTVDEPAQGVHA